MRFSPERPMSNDSLSPQKALIYVMVVTQRRIGT